MPRPSAAWANPSVFILLALTDRARKAQQEQGVSHGALATNVKDSQRPMWTRGALAQERQTHEWSG